MTDALAPGATGIVIEREAGASSVLRLRGRMGRRGAVEFDAAVADVLASWNGPLVIDIVDLLAEAGAIVALLNGVAARRLPSVGALTVRVLSDSAAFGDMPLHPAILVEPMLLAPTVAQPAHPAPATKADASPGTARREGRGFVASYGAGRRCGEPGCGTTLSRYNERGVCFSHAAPER